MAATWSKSQYPGVRFREHSDRKHNGKADRYFAIRYYNQSKSIEEACGWSSEGWNAQKANIARNELVNNNRHGIRPMTLAEKRQIDKAERDAEEHAQAEDEAARREADAAEKAANITFGDLFKIYIDQAKHTKKTWHDDQSRYEFNVKEYIGNRPARNVSVFELERMKNSLKKKGKSAKTIHHSLSLVRTVYNKCELWGHYSGDNPATKVAYPKISDNDRVRFLSFDEVKLLLNELSKLPHTDTHDLTLMAAFTGARYLEIASLTWSDVNIESGYVTFLNTKTSKSRTVSSSQNVKDMLATRRPEGAAPSGYVFPKRDGRLRTQVPNSFPMIADRLFNVGVTDPRQKVVFHTLRHSYISWLIMNGADLRTVQQISGHETMAMLKRYSHLTGAHLQKAADRVEHAFNSNPHIVIQMDKRLKK
jgi:integrase